MGIGSRPYAGFVAKTEAEDLGAGSAKKGRYITPDGKVYTTQQEALYALSLWQQTSVAKGKSRKVRRLRKRWALRTPGEVVLFKKPEPVELPEVPEYVAKGSEAVDDNIIQLIQVRNEQDEEDAILALLMA